MPGARTISSWAVPCTVATFTASLAPMARCSPRWHRPARTIQMREAGHEDAGYQQWQSTSTARPSLPGLSLGTQILPQSFRILDGSRRLFFHLWARAIYGPYDIHDIV